MNTDVAASPIEMTEHEWALVQAILWRSAHDRTVWAYGSRARRKDVWKYSDLDLLLDGPPLKALAAEKLETEFDESRLPFRVQIQCLSEIDKDFHRRIKKDLVLLQTGVVGEGS